MYKPKINTLKNKLDVYVWDSLFCMSRAYKNVDIQACSFRLLVLCTSYMITIIGKEYRITNFINRFENTVKFFELNNCMCDNDFKNMCPTNSELFKLMMKYYNYIISLEGKAIQSYESLEKKYDVKFLTKKWWGPKIWYLIHTFATFYIESDDNLYLTNYKCFIMCLTKTLPCNECRTHFYTHITKKENDLNKFKKSNVDLLYWSFLIHNIANLSLQHEGKIQYCWKNALFEYFEIDN